jgi:hypothetical protein
MILFIIYAIIIGILIGYIRGGNLKWITNKAMKYVWLIFCSIAIQLVIFSSLPFIKLSPDYIIAALHLVSYTLIIIFILFNIKIPGIAIVGFGSFLNFLVIFLNGGFMPSVSSDLIKNFGKNTIDKNITTMSKHTYLPWLGDIFHLPAWLPLTNNFSIGDIIVALGVCIYFSLNMKAAIKE